MASLTGTKIKDTYDSLLKVSDNGGLGASAKQITDGLGTGSPLYIDTSKIGVGITPYTSASLLNLKGTGLSLLNDKNGNSNNWSLITNESTSDQATINFSTGAAANAMVIDHSGNVGIGTSSVTSGVKLQVQSSGGSILSIKDATVGSGQYSNIWFGDEVLDYVGFLGYSHSTDAMTFGTSGSERMRIDSSGNVLLSGGGYLATDSITNYSSAFTPLSIGGNSYLVFKSDSTERMRITSGGAVIIGTGGSFSAGSGNIQINRSPDGGYIQTSAALTTAVDHHYFYNPNGLVGRIETSGSSTSYITSSDYRLKENVVEMTGALDRVNALKPSRFNFIADPEKTVDGFLAHEVAEVVPEAISGEKDATEEYEVTPAEYKTVVVTPAQEAVYETIEHPAIAEELDADGNIIVEAQEAWTEQVLVSEAVKEVTEQVLVSEAVMGTRPVYQGIDQSKIVPLLVAAIQELKAEVDALKGV